MSKSPSKSPMRASFEIMPLLRSPNNSGKCWNLPMSSSLHPDHLKMAFNLSSSLTDGFLAAVRNSLSTWKFSCVKFADCAILWKLSAIKRTHIRRSLEHDWRSARAKYLGSEEKERLYEGQLNTVVVHLTRFAWNALQEITALHLSRCAKRNASLIFSLSIVIRPV